MKRPGPSRIPVTDVNPHLLCVLCGGYFIDATTIIECLHSYCRTCIVRYLETSKMCPLCDVLVHKTKPLENLRADKTLQDLVYKLVPGLFESEMANRRKFYDEHPEECETATLEDRGEAGMEKNVDTEHEKISLVLELSANGRPPDIPNVNAEITDRRYLLCPSGVNVGHLKKLIRLKFNVPLKYQIQFYHTRLELSDNLSLYDITTLYTWRRTEPLRLFYMIYNPPPRNRNLTSQELKRRRLCLSKAKQEKKIATMLEFNCKDKVTKTTTAVKSPLSNDDNVKTNSDVCTITRDVNENCVIRKNSDDSDFSMDDVIQFIKPKTPVNGKHKLSRINDCFVKPKIARLDIFPKSAKKSKYSESCKLLNDNKLVDGMKLLKINKNGDVLNNLVDEKKVDIIKTDVTDDIVVKSKTVDYAKLSKVKRKMVDLIRPGKNIKTSDVKPQVCTNPGEVKIEFNWCLPSNKISDVIMKSILPKIKSDPLKSSIVKAENSAAKKTKRETAKKSNRAKNTKLTPAKSSGVKQKSSRDCDVKKRVCNNKNNVRADVKLKPQNIEAQDNAIGDEPNKINSVIVKMQDKDKSTALIEFSGKECKTEIESSSNQTPGAIVKENGWLSKKTNSKVKTKETSDDQKKKPNTFESWEYLKQKYSKNRTKSTSQQNVKDNESKIRQKESKDVHSNCDVQIGSDKRSVNQTVETKINNIKSTDLEMTVKSNVVTTDVISSDNQVITDIIVTPNSVVNNDVTKDCKSVCDVTVTEKRLETVVKQTDTPKDIDTKVSPDKTADNNCEVNNFMRTKKQKAIDVIVKQINQRNDVKDQLKDDVSDKPKNDVIVNASVKNNVCTSVIQTKNTADVKKVDDDATSKGNRDKLNDVFVSKVQLDSKIPHMGESETRNNSDCENNKQNKSDTTQQHTSDTNKQNKRDNKGVIHKQNKSETNSQAKSETDNTQNITDNNKQKTNETNKQNKSETNTQNKGETNKQNKGDTNKQNKGETNKQNKNETKKQNKNETNKQNKNETNKQSKREIASSKHNGTGKETKKQNGLLTDNSEVDESALCEHNSLIFEAGFNTDPYSFEIDNQPLELSEVAVQECVKKTAVYNK